MLRIDKKALLKRIEYKQNTPARKSTIDSFIAAIANQSKRDKTRTVDFGSWRRAHPKLTDLNAKFGALHTLETDRPVYDEHNYLLREMLSKEQRPDFAARFRKREMT